MREERLSKQGPNENIKEHMYDSVPENITHLPSQRTDSSMKFWPGEFPSILDFTS